MAAIIGTRCSGHLVCHVGSRHEASAETLNWLAKAWPCPMVVFPGRWRPLMLACLCRSESLTGHFIAGGGGGRAIDEEVEDGSTALQFAICRRGNGLLSLYIVQALLQAGA